MQSLAASENPRLTRKTPAARAMASLVTKEAISKNTMVKPERLEMFFVQECNAYDRVAQKCIERLP